MQADQFSSALVKSLVQLLPPSNTKKRHQCQKAGPKILQNPRACHWIVLCKCLLSILYLILYLLSSLPWIIFILNAKNLLVTNNIWNIPQKSSFLVFLNESLYFFVSFVKMFYLLEYQWKRREKERGKERNKGRGRKERKIVKYLRPSSQ